MVFKKGIKCPQRKSSTSFKKGHIPWTKNKKHSEEAKKQMRQKRNEWHKNHPNAFKGKKNGMYGKGYLLKGHKVTKKAREKIREAQKRLIKEGKKKAFGYGMLNPSEKGEKNPFYGKHHTEKMRKELSEKKFKYYEEHPETIEKIKKARARQSPTFTSSQEIKIQNFLKVLGIEFFTHQYMKIEHSYQCDILIPSMNLIIECDGDFIHCNPIRYSPDFVRYPSAKKVITAQEIWERDKIRTQELIKKGFKVWRLWGSEIKEMNVNEFKNKIGNI